MGETVLITGGTGNIGSAAVALLANDLRRPEVRVATRDVRSPAARLLQAMSPETVKAVTFNEREPATLRKAFEGVTRLFVVAPFVADLGAWHEPIAAAAKECGTCAHIVKVSVTGARSPDTEPKAGRIPAMHWQGEEYLRKSGIATTAIRPTMFMQHFLTMPPLYRAGEDRFYLPTGQARVAFLDCRDNAAFAVAILMGTGAERERHTGAAYELSGPQALSGADIADVLSSAADRPIAHVDGEDALVARTKELGAPDTLKLIYREAAGGWFSKVEIDSFERTTGRRPTSFAEFALDYAGHFRKRAG
jgi:uncharacterized protein YbjT (DUF2867 family)